MNRTTKTSFASPTSIGLLVCCLALKLAACAATGEETRQEPPPGYQYDASRGFLGGWQQPSATLEPVQADERFFRVLEQLAKAEDYSPASVADLESYIPELSQQMAAAATSTLIRTGTVYGSAAMIELGCKTSKVVTFGALRRANYMQSYQDVCTGLHSRGAVRQPCAASQQKLREAYRKLLEEDEKQARTLAAEGVNLRAGCASAPLRRAPAAPSTDGFITTVIMQSLTAEPRIYLGGEKLDGDNDTWSVQLLEQLDRDYASNVALVAEVRS